MWLHRNDYEVLKVLTMTDFTSHLICCFTKLLYTKPVQLDLQSEYFKELHCFSIINAYTLCGRIANPNELNLRIKSAHLCILSARL